MISRRDLRKPKGSKLRLRRGRMRRRRRISRRDLRKPKGRELRLGRGGDDAVDDRDQCRVLRDLTVLGRTLYLHHKFIRS